MNVLLTGSQGYIGTVLSQLLIKKNYKVTGYDAGFFKENILGTVKENYEIIQKDIRDLDENDLKNVDAIVHLAGLSNDPLGEFSPILTEQINFEATKKIANLAKKCGISRFVYASSQSMYGVSNTSDELDEDNSIKNPITSYAKAKWDAELYLNGLNSNDFTVTSFRPSTVFGVSNRLRCDVVFNNLVACAYTTGKIEIKSDGSPWRPVIHVKDVCSAFIAGLEAPIKLVAGKSFNVGIRNGNYTVKELAEAAQKAVPGSELIFTGEHTDPRTYKVSFERIFKSLSDYYKPKWDLEKGGKELVNFFKEIKFNIDDFRGRSTTRLSQLLYLNKNNKIDNSLRFR